MYVTLGNVNVEIIPPTEVLVNNNINDNYGNNNNNNIKTLLFVFKSG
jgi:hypothetical protein